MTNPLFGAQPRALQLLTAKEAKSALADLARAAKTQDCPRLAELLAAGGADADFLAAVMSLSPFLRSGMLLRPNWLEALFDAPLDDRIDTLIAGARQAATEETLSENGLMARLRALKAETHCLIALADLAGTAETLTTTRRLSQLAEACLGATVDFLLRDAARAGKLTLADTENPSAGSGWIVLGMGKFGAHELNYSSDIDLIVFFDPAIARLADPTEAVDTFSRLTRRLVRIMQERTADGYVFRTDLRLRPDPGSMPLAIPLDAALVYYEGRGQNWERAALIKARPVAGDIKAGEAVLAELRPFVWRRYLDYAAIADVHSIKRQIHAHKGHGEIAVEGHNIKLGRGGIREIEFFVQTQQLIAGGRFPELRGRETLPMLAELYARGWITERARDNLTRIYCRLRDVEHRIQMVADEQTHTLPTDKQGLERVARLAGFADAKAFRAEFIDWLKTVEHHYAGLFEKEAQLSDTTGNLVFTGDEPDPDTLTTLSGLGFKRPADMWKAIQVWHFGRYRATRSVEARERLTELTPALLQAFADSGTPDEALLRFDEFIKGLPAGIQLFSLLHGNPRLLSLLVTIMAAAPRLAEIITAKPHAFDGMLDPQFFTAMPTRDELEERLSIFLREANGYEETLDRLRIFVSEQKFLVGVRLLTGAIDGARAGHAFSDLADLAIARALEAARADLAVRHGVIAGGRIALIGMGKLGSRELTAGSDVDLIMLYDHPEEVTESDGAKPLAPQQYHIRLTQKLIAALSAPTAEGILYEVDFRLRPSGNKGPLATSFRGFCKYQREEAWTWEHMALTRARPVAGDAALCAAIRAEVDAILALPHDGANVAKDMKEMRALIEQEKPGKSIWDLKLAAGGVIDLEFIAQFARLTGLTDAAPGETSPHYILVGLNKDKIEPQVKDELLQALKLYTELAQVIRLCASGNFDPQAAPAGFVERMCAAVDFPDVKTLAAHLKNTEQTVRGHFRTLFR